MLNLINLFLFFISSFLITLPIEGYTPHCIVRRVAFDIGSGQIKMQVSDVDATHGKLVNVLLMDGAKVPLREDLAKSLDCRISPEMENLMINSIKELIRKTETFHPQEFHAVATESFRLAKNGNEILLRIKKETGLDITVVSQEEEGILGFISANNEVNYPPEKTVVFDFGAGSFQITTKTRDGYSVFHGRLGKIPFRNILLDIQGKDVNQTLTPNPISREDLCQALKYIDEHVKELPVEILQKLKQPDTIVLSVGIHSLWYMGNRDSYNQQMVLQEIENRLGLDNNAIFVKDVKDPSRQDAASFVVSNLILNYGLMKALGIQQIKYVGTPGANAVGALLSPKYWKECK